MHAINTVRFLCSPFIADFRPHTEDRSSHGCPPESRNVPKIVSYSRIPFGQRNSLRWQGIPIACTGVSQRATNKVSSYNSAHELNMCGQYYWQACDHPIVTRA